MKIDIMLNNVVLASYNTVQDVVRNNVDRTLTLSMSRNDVPVLELSAVYDVRVYGTRGEVTYTNCKIADVMINRGLVVTVLEYDNAYIEREITVKVLERSYL